MKTYPLVSLTLITWNRVDDVRESLLHIFKIDYPNYEVIAVDNGSTDGVTKMIESEFPKVRLLMLGKNTGLFARNVSFRNAKGEFIVTLDDDSHPEPDAIAKMVKRFREDSCLGIIAFQIPCGDYFSTEYWPESSASSTHLYIGSGSGIKKEVFHDIGYYDELLGGYAEEFDFTYRAMAAGYTVGHFKEIVAHHRPRKNPNRLFRFFYQNERNQQYIMGKFVSPRYWPLLYIRSLFYRLMRAYSLEGTKALWYAILGNTWGARHIFAGYKNRVRIPAYVEYRILTNRLYTLPLWRMLFIEDRKRVFMSARRVCKDHSHCPRKIDLDVLYSKMDIPVIPKTLQIYYDLRSKLVIFESRKIPAGEKEKIRDQIRKELSRVSESVQKNYEIYRSIFEIFEKRFGKRGLKLFNKILESRSRPEVVNWRGNRKIPLHDIHRTS